MADGIVNLFVCGDVMTGRGIDQILAHPCPPRIHEPYVRDARDYVRLAERANGPIPRGVDGSYPWRDIMPEWGFRQPLVRLANLETAVTTSETPWPGKGIHYRMHPENPDVLTSAGFDICSLANNHVLDWGFDGLRETLETLRNTGIAFAGAGETRERAMAPAVHHLAGDRRILVFSMGLGSSGIPEEWAATPDCPGVHLLDSLDGEAVSRLAELVGRYRRDGDLVVASIHWGANWGYGIPPAHQAFARGLIDEGVVDLIHGHSSHHPLGIEIYRGKPILYGCGDFLNDYEGIAGTDAYRSHLCLMYFFRFDLRKPEFLDLELLPLEIRKFRLQPPSDQDRKWLLETIRRESAALGTSVEADSDRSFHVRISEGTGQSPG